MGKRKAEPKTQFLCVFALKIFSTKVGRAIFLLASRVGNEGGEEAVDVGGGENGFEEVGGRDSGRIALIESVGDDEPVARQPDMDAVLAAVGAVLPCGSRITMEALNRIARAL